MFWYFWAKKQNILHAKQKIAKYVALAPGQNILVPGKKSKKFLLILVRSKSKKFLKAEKAKYFEMVSKVQIF